MSSAAVLLTPGRGGVSTRGMGSATQADALQGDPFRRVSHRPGGVPSLLCASGRGGSGTTLLSALMAVAAAGDGQRVLLVDTDDLLGPLAISLGVTPRASWMDLRGGAASPRDITTPVSATLTLVAGGPAQRSNAQNVSQTLTAAERRACLQRVSTLADAYDLVVMDCGARLDTVLAAIAPHDGERILAVVAGLDPIALASTYALIKAVHTRHGALPVDVLVNRHEGREAANCFEAVDAGARQFLDLALRQAGAVPSDPTLDAALRAGMPFADAAVGSPAALAAHDVVLRALAVRSSSRSGT